MPISDTGIWITDDGDVVFEQPRGGSTQVVSKGGEISGDARARLEREGFTGQLPGDEPAEATPDDLTVTTDDVTPKKRAAKKK